jgi:5'-3' exonuclease
MSRLLIIDGDFILWRITPNKVLSETEVMYGVSNERSFEQICKELDEYLITKIFIPTQAEFYIGYLGGGVQRDFRRNQFIEYKANREGREKPKYFADVWLYMLNKWKFFPCGDVGIEADDACLITEKRLKEKPEDEVIIVCQDKDLLNTEGVRYNPVKDEWKTTSALEEYYLFWRSMITGDTADAIKGVPGKGVRTAEYILEKVHITQYPQEVFRQYLEAFKTEAIAIEQFYKNYKMLWILREKEDFIVPEIQSINNREEKEEPLISFE